MSGGAGRLRALLESRLFSFVFDHLKTGDLARSYRRGQRLSRLGPRLQRRDWDWTIKSLQLVFGPALDEKRCRRLAGLVYENLFHTLADGLHCGEVRATTAGLEKLLAAHESGRGVIVCGMHLGSWDIGLRELCATGVPTAVVYRPTANPRIRQRMREIGGAWGVRWIRLDDPWSLVRWLRDGHVLSIMCDQTPGERGVCASFLGVRTVFPQGPARLALRLGAPVVIGIHVREGPGDVTTRCESIIDPRLARSAQRPAEDLTRRIAQAFEPWLLEYAEQYNWACPIWRHRPAGGMWDLAEANETIRGGTSSAFAPLSARVQRLIT